MSYRVVIHSSAPIGHHGNVFAVSYETRAGAEAYARTAREEDPDATIRVDGQHEEPAAPLEVARKWMTYISHIWASAPQFTDHDHRHGAQRCPICAR